MVSRRSRWRPKDSRPYVRPSVRMYVTLLLENRSLLFSETLQLVRACKWEKNVPSAFLKKLAFWPFLAIFQASPLIFKYSGVFNPITCIHFLKALDVSFDLSYYSSVYHKNCGVINFYTRLRLERHQDLRTILLKKTCQK